MLVRPCGHSFMGRRMSKMSYRAPQRRSRMVVYEHLSSHNRLQRHKDYRAQSAGNLAVHAHIRHGSIFRRDDQTLRFDLHEGAVDHCGAGIMSKKLVFLRCCKCGETDTSRKPTFNPDGSVATFDYVGTATTMRCPDCADAKGQGTMCRACCPTAHGTRYEFDDEARRG